VSIVTGHRVAAAVSGGADSVALAWWLHAQADRVPQPVTFAGIIHVNHQLRGAEADRDEAFCRGLAERLGVPIEVVVAPIPARPGRSPEAAARTARYRAFDEAARRLRATRVATAHTADDQAETVLLRLLRGAGSRGVSGIRAQRDSYVRPFLRSSRSDVRAWLDARGESFCEDSTNADRAIARNRLRHDLLPVIRQIAPGGVAALARAATLAEDDERVLQGLAIESSASAVLWADTTGADLDREVVAALPPATARRVLRLVLEQVAPGAAWSAAHLEAVLRLASRSRGGGSVDLPAVRVERVSNLLRVRVGPAQGATPFEYQLPGPGEVFVPEAGISICASTDLRAAYSLVVPPSAFPLTIRNRRPGDRVGLVGGTRKAQDLMVDAKIPRSERDTVPLVVASNGQVLWVYGPVDRGVPASERAAPGMVVLRVRKMERT
jgi:tRNA(Ile)-lysidine synthase